METSSAQRPSIPLVFKALSGEIVLGSCALMTEVLCMLNDTYQVNANHLRLQAKRGGFRGKGDCLLTLDDVENITLEGPGATLRMWREDYANTSLYNYSEGRHGVSLHGQ